jgi:hypothetical protein
VFLLSVKDAGTPATARTEGRRPFRERDRSADRLHRPGTNVVLMPMPLSISNVESLRLEDGAAGNGSEGEDLRTMGQRVRYLSRFHGVHTPTDANPDSPTLPTRHSNTKGGTINGDFCVGDRLQ